MLGATVFLNLLHTQQPALDTGWVDTALPEDAVFKHVSFLVAIDFTKSILDADPVLIHLVCRSPLEFHWALISSFRADTCNSDFVVILSLSQLLVIDSLVTDQVQADHPTLLLQVVTERVVYAAHRV